MPISWEEKNLGDKRLVQLIEKASKLATEVNIKLQNGRKVGVVLAALLDDLRRTPTVNAPPLGRAY